MKVGSLLREIVHTTMHIGILGTVRASFALYNTKEEVDAMVAGVKRVAMMF